MLKDITLQKYMVVNFNSLIGFLYNPLKILGSHSRVT